METGKGNTMAIKWIGAVFVVIGCGGVGFLMASAYRLQENDLRQLIQLLEFMSCELSYRLTPLPELCHKAGGQAKGNLKTVFFSLAESFERYTQPDAEQCMADALRKLPQLPSLTRRALIQLGTSLGQFDLEGQLKGLTAVQMFCKCEYDKLSNNRTERLRSYQTLGLCAGAALAILLI